ncbi:hypothetical protein PS862_00251 [Pseudomonas fluorescens]|uniref:Uncharacterized protein n=1 Tax=Pseudomonas fluorescens TaxID=294 RepID=A0A5E7GLQ2_PSEFL|nr:hypothetical protein [Pseudomonas fluorescens]VVO49793.1 hypothetical protein PS862_00251 [Pseudomonas fluorescens]
MVDQAGRLETATVKAEAGSNIVYRFANDTEAAAAIPTGSGDIPNLKQVIASMRDTGAGELTALLENNRTISTSAPSTIPRDGEEWFVVEN